MSAISSSPGNWPKWVTGSLVSPQSEKAMAAITATTRKTSTAATFKNWIFSRVWYTTGEMVSVSPMATRAQIAIRFASPPPNRKVVTVAELVAQAGQMFGTIAHRHITIPSGFHMAGSAPVSAGRSPPVVGAEPLWWTLRPLPSGRGRPRPC
jgi:hypothetical protein